MTKLPRNRGAGCWPCRTRPGLTPLLGMAWSAVPPAAREPAPPALRGVRREVLRLHRDDAVSAAALDEGSRRRGGGGGGGGGVVVPWRALSAGPRPLGAKLESVVMTSLSMVKPSSRIQTFTTCTPVVATCTVATGPSMVPRDHVQLAPKPVMRSELATSASSRTRVEGIVCRGAGDAARPDVVRSRLDEVDAILEAWARRRVAGIAETSLLGDAVSALLPEAPAGLDATKLCPPFATLASWCSASIETYPVGRLLERVAQRRHRVAGRRSSHRWPPHSSTRQTDPDRGQKTAHLFASNVSCTATTDLHQRKACGQTAAAREAELPTMRAGGQSYFGRSREPRTLRRLGQAGNRGFTVLCPRG